MRHLLLLAACTAWASAAVAQVPNAITAGESAIEALEEVPSIGRNSVNDLQVAGNAVWIAPRLNLTTNGGQTWLQADVDSLTDDRGSVFALDVDGDTVWAALGHTKLEDVTGDGRQDEIPTAIGFAVSTDGGQTWAFRFPGLDLPTDETIAYGISTLPFKPAPVPELATTYDLEFDPRTGTTWAASWYGGLRRSDDLGRTWQYVVLPPDTLSAIRPDQPYTFTVGPDDAIGARANNFKAFAVLVDETGTVWAGTAGGLNRSVDGVSWDRFAFDGSANSLVGDWVIAVEEQPLPGRNPIWIASRAAAGGGEDFGITVTRDGGQTFEQVLVGERINNFAFRGETVYAAGDQGLFISDDGGISWRTVRDFHDAASGQRLSFTTRVISVATTPTALWAGTSEGLARSTDGGQTWQIFRTDVPLHPETPTDRVPDVDTYAYPNPFSPEADRFIRIRYETTAANTVEVRVFDFGMNLVREISDAAASGGAREAMWDGTDDHGLRVANGPYFYSVTTDGETVWGKILLIE